MDAFSYYNPTRLVFGLDQTEKLSELLPEGVVRVMILYGGGSVFKNGVMDEVQKALGSIAYETFGGIEANPDYATCLKAVEAIKKSGADFVLAVGGGSVIDAAKFIVAAAHYQGDPWEILTTRGATIQSALPFGAVQTLPATASEVNKGSVISRRETGEKRAFGHELVFPRFAILDPKFTYSLPYRQVANGVVDAFVHVLEQYATFPAGNHLSDEFAEGVMRTLHKEGLRAESNLKDYECRSNLALACSFALSGLLAQGTPQDWSSHYIGHYLTAKYGMDHARTLAITAPAVLKELSVEKGQKIAQMGARVFGVESDNHAEAVKKSIQVMEAFFKKMGMPVRLSDEGIDNFSDEAALKWIDESGVLPLTEQNISNERIFKIFQNMR